MAAVFTQMQGDAICASLLGAQSGLHHARIFGSSCLAYSRHVINIHTQF
jgi:hypothetical protein